MCAPQTTPPGEAEAEAEEEDVVAGLFKHDGTDNNGMMVHKTEEERRRADEIQARVWPLFGSSDAKIDPPARGRPVSLP